MEEKTDVPMPTIKGKEQVDSALLPPVPGDKEHAICRVLYCLDRLSDDLMKFHYLMTVKRDDPDTFYAAALQNIDRIMPLVYTPTVGTACLHYDKVFQPHHGVYLPISQKGRVKEFLQQWPENNIEAIVFTDGEAILGLGDLGAHGMGIPIGKMALYSLCAGIHPKACLPVTLDVGTNNEDLRNSPCYMGLHRERVRGQEYEEFVQEFFDAARDLYGNAVLLQFEDFGNGTAFPLLERFRDSACTFNDDIQGTAAVITAGLLTASREAKVALKDMSLVFYGAGAAGVGIADLIAYTIAREAGCSLEEARKNIYLVDSKGLITGQREEASLAGHKKPYAHAWDSSRGDVPVNLEAIVKTLKPHALIGVSAQPQTFTQDIIEAMAAANERPIIFALSNPTSKSECTAEQAYKWSGGKALFASGSPFAAVELADGRVLKPGQGNNSYIFPGIALGAVASKARTITEEMFFAAAQALSKMVTAEDLAVGTIYPPLTKIREVSIAIAQAIAQEAEKQGYCQLDAIPEDWEKHIRESMYDPLKEN